MQGNYKIVWSIPIQMSKVIIFSKYGSRKYKDAILPV